MATEKWSGYYGLQTLISSAALNVSIATGAGAIGSPIDNRTNLYEFMDVVLTLGTNDFSSVSNPSFALYLLLCMDGTNYEYGSESVPPVRTPDAIIPVPSVSLTGPQYFSRARIIIPPGLFTPLIYNNTGTILGDSGNALQYNPYCDTAA